MVCFSQHCWFYTQNRVRNRVGAPSRQPNVDTISKARLLLRLECVSHKLMCRESNIKSSTGWFSGTGHFGTGWEVEDH